MKEIAEKLPEYDYIYLGDNARAPYGTRSFDIVYDFTLQAVKALFDRGCHLVILACNTASAKALRSIQQNDLPLIDPSRRVLGVIRPTVEILPEITKSRHIGLLATPGTVASHSYAMELEKMDPEMKITEHACPMWVPIIENNEASSPGADYFVKKYIDEIMAKDPEIDTLVLGCTHYPLLLDKIKQYAPAGVKILAQGKRVADSLADYLRRHPEIERKCGKNGISDEKEDCLTTGNRESIITGSREFLTTENSGKFNSLASLFLGMEVRSNRICL